METKWRAGIRGMETARFNLLTSSLVSLETFLSGMETRRTCPSPATYFALKPSLVEWKLFYLPFIIPKTILALKPSLVEWKLFWNIENRNHISTLKPSLVEWKHQTKIDTKQKEFP